jgi:hypothetical protein
MPEIQEYWATAVKMAQPHDWHHESAGRIREATKFELAKRIGGDEKELLSEIFRIRCLFGKFEDRIGITLKDRQELTELFFEAKSVASICLVLNREPDLLESVVNFQVPDFHQQLLSAIIRKVQEGQSEEFIARTDVIEFVATQNPMLIIDNLDELLDTLICTENECTALIAKLTCSGKISHQIEVLQKLSERINELSKTNKLVQYLRGLCQACLSWLNIERAREASTDVQRAVFDLQAFYKPKEGPDRPHGGATEYGYPLDRIIDHISLIQKRRDASHQSLYDAVYRDWRDLTGKIFESRIRPSIMAIEGILRLELSPTLAEYYLGKEGLTQDYLELQRWLSILKGSDTPSVDLMHRAEEIIRITKRFFRRIFDEAESSIAKVVKSIPVRLDTYIRQHVNYNALGVPCDFEFPDEQITAFMSSTQFERILDLILTNIQRHNLALPETKLEDAASLSREVRVQAKIRIKQSKIEIIIRSNGPNLYSGNISHGLRTIHDICERFNAKYLIQNQQEWVENILYLERW